MESQLGKALWAYLTPVIVLTGLVGNVLTLITVLNKHSKKTSFTVILAALAICDSAYLVCWFKPWLENTNGVSLENSGIVWCKLIWYLLFTLPHISVWLVTVLAAERAFSVYFPLKVKTLCVTKTGIIIAATIVALFAVTDLHLMFGFTLAESQNATDIVCTLTNNGYKNFFYLVYTWIDLVIGFILPAAASLSFNIVTVVKFRKSTMSAKKRETVKQLIIIACLVSTTFIVLYFPALLYQLIRPYIFDLTVDKYGNSTDEVIHTLFVNTIVLSHAVNFILYVFSGKRFRQELRQALCGSTN